jgi:hypothetical protein
MADRVTFYVPDKLKQRMDARPDVNWPEVFKKGLGKKLEALEKLRSKGEL